MVDFNVNAIQEGVTNHASQVAQDVMRMQQQQVPTSVQTTEARAPETAAVREIDAKTISDVVSQMNSVMQSTNQSLRFSFEGSGAGQRMVVKVTDPKGQVVRTIPSEEFVEMHEKISSTVGMIYNRKG